MLKRNLNVIKLAMYLTVAFLLSLALLLISHNCIYMIRESGLPIYMIDSTEITIQFWILYVGGVFIEIVTAGFIALTPVKNLTSNLIMSCVAAATVHLAGSIFFIGQWYAPFSSISYAGVAFHETALIIITIIQALLFLVYGINKNVDLFHATTVFIRSCNNALHDISWPKGGIK